MVVSESPGSTSGTHGPIRAIMFTQFEDVEGYVVAASDPPNVMTDQFKDIGYHFLPDRGICWRLISLSVGDYRIVGVPVHIDDPKYARRAFVFCFCLITDKTGVEIAKLAAQHLAHAFHELEVQSSFLSTDANRDSLKSFLVKIRERLNSEKVSCINTEIADEVSLQFSRPTGVAVVQSSTRAEMIRPWHIPVSICHTSHEEVPCHDLSLVLSECNGEASVSEISNSLQIEFGDLVEILDLLKTRNLVHIIDQPVDKFARVRLTGNFHSFFDDLTNRQTALTYSLSIHHSAPSGRASVSSSGTSSPRSISAATADPILNIGDQLVRMYCRLDGHVEDLGEFSAANSSFPNISVRQMVIFGLVKNFIRCKVMFPYYAEHAASMIPVLRSCDGSLSWDEIGYKHGLCRTEMDEIFTYHGVLRIWK